MSSILFSYVHKTCKTTDIFEGFSALGGDEESQIVHAGRLPRLPAGTPEPMLLPPAAGGVG